MIHRGNAHGGHYHTYIRDCMGEGDWEHLMKDLAEEERKKGEKQVKNEKNQESIEELV